MLGEDHPDTLITMNNLAFLYMKQGRYAQAEPLYIKALEVQRRVLGENNPRRLASMNDFAFLSLKRRRFAQAESLLREALNGCQKAMPERLAPVPLPELAWRQPSRSKEVCGGRTAPTFWLQRNRSARTDNSLGTEVRFKAIFRVDRPTLRQLGKTGQGHANGKRS